LLAPLSTLCGICLNNTVITGRITCMRSLARGLVPPDCRMGEKSWCGLRGIHLLQIRSRSNRLPCFWYCLCKVHRGGGAPTFPCSCYEIERHTPLYPPHSSLCFILNRQNGVSLPSSLDFVMLHSPIPPQTQQLFYSPYIL